MTYAFISTASGALLALALPNGVQAAAQPFSAEHSAIGCRIRASGPLPVAARPNIREAIDVDADLSGEFIHIAISWSEPLPTPTRGRPIRRVEDSDNHILELGTRRYGGFRDSTATREEPDRYEPLRPMRYHDKSYSGSISEPGILEAPLKAGSVAIVGGSSAPRSILSEIRAWHFQGRRCDRLPNNERFGVRHDRRAPLPSAARTAIFSCPRRGGAQCAGHLHLRDESAPDHDPLALG